MNDVKAEEYPIWNAYKDNLNEEALAALRDVIENQDWESTDFDVSVESLEDCFRWSDTTQGGRFWYDVHKGKYDKATDTHEETYGSIPRCVKGDYGLELNTLKPTTATSFLKQAVFLQEQRAAEYDQEGGERSAGKVAAAFNAITGHSLTESDVWMLLVVLKQVRFYNNPSQKHRDSVEDLVSYSALFAESVFKGENK